MAPPPVMNQTWLPSQCGPTVLIITRRSVSVLPTKGSRVPTPMSWPSMTAKPSSSTPTSSHQISFRVS
jgi:hypothetical protein